MKISRINSLVRTHMLDGAPCSVVDVNGCLSYDDDRFPAALASRFHSIPLVILKMTQR